MEGCEECIESCAVTRRFPCYHMTSGKVIMDSHLPLHSDKLKEILSQKCNTTRTAFR